jgi:hypothetical protein
MRPFVTIMCSRARIDDHLGDACGEERRAGVLLADDGLHGQHGAVSLDHVEPERGDVDEDVARAEVLRHPAPALHVHGDLPRAIGDGDVHLA